MSDRARAPGPTTAERMSTMKAKIGRERTTDKSKGVRLRYDMPNNLAKTSLAEGADGSGRRPVDRHCSRTQLNTSTGRGRGDDGGTRRGADTSSGEDGGGDEVREENAQDGEEHGTSN